MKKTDEQLADALCEINASISLYWIGLKKVPTMYNIIQLNKELAEIIRELRKSK